MLRWKREQYMDASGEWRAPNDDYIDESGAWRKTGAICRSFGWLEKVNNWYFTKKWFAF